VKKKSRQVDYPTKACNMCGIEKEREEFYNHENSVGGIRNCCIECFSARKKKVYAEKRKNILASKIRKPTIKEEPKSEEVYTPIFKDCNRCKISKDTKMFHRINDTRSKSGVGPYCKICDNEMRVANRARPVGRFKSMISDAKRWKHDWSLTYEEFLTFWQKPCNYCGAEIKTCSLDRVDTSLGYSLENVVSCCHDCNQFKMDQTLAEFKTQIEALYLNLEGIRLIRPFDFSTTNQEHCYICGELKSLHKKKCRDSLKRVFCKTEEERIARRRMVVLDNSKTPRGRYSTYKKKAKFKEINWSLSQDDFYLMWKRPCSYCLRPIDGIGVDRIDSSIGYRADNVTPCCGRCNTGKMSHSASKFADLIGKIFLNLVSV
jgi:hypothetical protein